MEPQKLLDLCSDILKGKMKRGIIPPLWDGQAGRRIIEALTKQFDS